MLLQMEFHMEHSEWAMWIRTKTSWISLQHDQVKFTVSLMKIIPLSREFHLISTQKNCEIHCVLFAQWTFSYKYNFQAANLLDKDLGKKLNSMNSQSNFLLNKLAGAWGLGLDRYANINGYSATFIENCSLTQSERIVDARDVGRDSSPEYNSEVIPRM